MHKGDVGFYGYRLPWLTDTKHMRFRASNLPLLVGLVLVMAAAVWVAGDAQRRADSKATDEAAANDEVVHSLQSQDRELNAYLATGQAEFLHGYEAAGRAFERAVANAEATIGNEPKKDALLTAEIASARRWQRTAHRTLAQGNGGPPPPSTLAAEREAGTEVMLNRAEDLDQVIDSQNKGESTTGWIALGSVVLLGALVLGLGFAARSDDRRRRRARRFGEGLQAARSEDEAYELVKAHIERDVTGSEVFVFNRNNSADRLEPSTPVAEGSRLDRALEGAKPDDCLAVRTAKPAAGGTRSDDVVSCQICGKLDGGSLCVPSIVGGEVIGSVLVRNKKLLNDVAGYRVNEGVTEAAPVLAHLRNLAIAERRAASDTLTGLPNKRAAEDTLKRLVAQAGRNEAPMAAIVFDLDHFKQINDKLGHPKGDEVLASVGSVVKGTLRDHDFAARFGGEEFLVLLQGTDREGGRNVAEKLRIAIAGLRVPEVDGIRASFGVAALPEDADGREELLRRADRALYVAKRTGRNRVETAEEDTQSSLPPSANGATAAEREATEA
jgi:diguanylate cyclase (GGDEF)-like protein